MSDGEGPPPSPGGGMRGRRVGRGGMPLSLAGTPVGSPLSGSPLAGGGGWGGGHVTGGGQQSRLQVASHRRDESMEEAMAANDMGLGSTADSWMNKRTQDRPLYNPLDAAIPQQWVRVANPEDADW
eukprot:gene28893-32086_t